MSNTMLKDNKQKIYWRVPKLFSFLEQEKISSIKKYHDELLKFNRTINLISARTESESDIIHFSDSLLAGRLILEGTKCPEIYDIGSGNGFPGIIMSILDSNRKINLIESDRRKSEFLKHIKNLLKLENLNIQTSRIEEMPENSIQCATSRGFTSLGRALLFTRKIIKQDGEYYHLKSDEWSVELATLPAQICSIWSTSLFAEYALPVSEVKMAILLSKKI